MDWTVLFWVAGIIAAVFIFAIFFDSVRRRRILSRKRNRYGASVEDYSVGFFRRIRLACRTMSEELARRRRHNVRDRRRDR